MNSLGALAADFRNVFRGSFLAVVRRIPKAFSVLYRALKADEMASPHFPIRLQLEVTNRCNYRCIMCDRENLVALGKKLNDVVDFGAFKKLVDEIAPLYLTLNGLGEPLMNRDMFKILALCAERGITSSMPTNLGFINDELFEKLVGDPPTILTVSMHGATKETYEAITQSRVYDRFLQYFEKLIARLGPEPLRILCALQAKNLGEFEAYYDFLTQWNMLDRFSLVPVFDYQTPMPEDRRVIPTQEEKDRALHALDATMASTTVERKKRFLSTWREKLLEIKSYDSTHEEGPCFIPWISTYILSNGDVLPCCYLSGEHHKMGNVFEQPFSDIWNGQRYRAFRAQIRDDRGHLQGCKNCPRSDWGRLKRYRFLIGGLRRSGWRRRSE